jgi:hypothetical protein
LSQVQQGIVRRDERFGYVELATSGFKRPCLTLDAAPLPNSAPPHSIEVSRHNGATQVTFAVEMKFDLESGTSKEWQRLKIVNLD